MRKTWTDEEVNFIINLSGKMSDNELRIAMEQKFQKEIKLDNLRKKRQRLGIKKSHGKNSFVISTGVVEQ